MSWEILNCFPPLLVSFLLMLSESGHGPTHTHSYRDAYSPTHCIRTTDMILDYPGPRVFVALSGKYLTAYAWRMSLLPDARFSRVIHKARQCVRWSITNTRAEPLRRSLRVDGRVLCESCLSKFIFEHRDSSGKISVVEVRRAAILPVKLRCVFCGYAILNTSKLTF